MRHAEYVASLLVGALLGVQGAPASLAQQPAQESAVASTQITASAQAAKAVPGTVVLPEGTDVALTFDQDLSSKTAVEGDTVEFVLAEAVKVGDVIVARAGCKAVGEITNAKKSGMMGKAGELNIRLDYVKVGNMKVHLRGTKGKEGASGTGAAVALTVLFGPIGLIKHGKNIEIKKGAPMKAYVADDISLPPAS